MGVTMMKFLNTFIVLVALIGVSGATQVDTTTSQKKGDDDPKPQKAIISVENPKALTGVTPKNRTTWTSIKQLFE